MSGYCYELFHSPISKKKLLIFGLLLLFLMILVIVLAVALTPGDSSNDRSEGHDVLIDTPLIVGSNDLPTKLRTVFRNKINDLDFDTLSNVSTNLRTLKTGLVGTQFWTVGANCDAQNKDALAVTLEQIDVMTRLIRRYQDKMSLVQDSSDVDRDLDKKRLGCLLSVGGGHCMDSRLAALRTFSALGVRAMTLTQGCPTPWAGNATKINETGLADFGKDVINEMNRLGLIVDLYGSSHAVQLAALNVTRAPVIFSQANAFNVTQHDLNVKDDVLELLAANRGLIMISFVKDLVGANSSIESLLVHLNYLKDKVGVDHIGIGSGYDSSNGDLIGGLDYPGLFDRLARPIAIGEKRWDWDELEKLAGANFKRVLTQVIKVSRGQLMQLPIESYEDKNDFKTNFSATCYTDFNYNKTNN